MVDQGLANLTSNLKARVSAYTVDRLKGIIQGFNEHCGSNLSRSGKKSDLQEKVKAQLDQWEAGGSTVSLNGANKVLDHIDTHGAYNGAALVQSLHAPSPLIKKQPLPPPPMTSSSSHANGAGPSNDRPPQPVARPSHTGIPFKVSPFFEIDQPVSAVTTCPESLHMQDRKSSYFDFQLNAEQREKLLAPGSKYQLRIYCTSSAFYTAPTAFRPQPTNGPCPMEFPNTCEIRVNNNNLHAATKGLKKKPGTAPPAHLGPHVRTGVGAVNKVEMIYCNNNPIQGQPPNNRKYFLQVNLVKETTTEELVQRLRKGKYRSKDEVLRQRHHNNVDDDDIVAGPTKMSLKCPLSYSRITVPSRSWLCPHPQCFDAESWYGMMETTTTWMCPICEKVLGLDDMVVDGYFDSILKATHEDVEDVMVEADGEWHTIDNKYHSAGWIPPVTTTTRNGSTSSSTAIQSPNSIPPDRPKLVEHVPATFRPPNEEIILDSDDEDEEDDARVRRQIGLGGSLKVAAAAAAGDDDVIDLTLSSDEEEDVPLRTQVQSFNGGKRRERSPTEPLDGYKRQRLDTPMNERLPMWDRRSEAASGSGGFQANGSSGTNNYGVRSSFSSNHLPALQIGGGSYRGSGTHVSPPSPLPFRSPILPPPPPHPSNNGIHLPPLQFPNGRHPPPSNTLRGRTPTSTSSPALSLLSRPDWRPPPPSDVREYRRYDDYDGSRRW